MTLPLEWNLVEYVDYFLKRIRHHLKVGLPSLEAFGEVSIGTIAKFGADKVKDFIEGIHRDFRNAFLLQQ